MPRYPHPDEPPTPEGAAWHRGWDDGRRFGYSDGQHIGAIKATVFWVCIAASVLAGAMIW